MESNDRGDVDVVAMLLTWQLGMVVFGLVLCEPLTVVHFPELEKGDAGRFYLMLLVVFEQVGQLRQFLLGLSRHEGTEQEQNKEYFGEHIFHCKGKDSNGFVKGTYLV